MGAYGTMGRDEHDFPDHPGSRRGRGASTRPAPDAHGRRRPAGLRRLRVRRHAGPARRVPRLRQRRRRGVDGRRDRRLVRRHRPVQAPARHPCAAHGPGASAQGRTGQGTRGVRRRELPAGRDHPRPRGVRDDLEARGGVAHRPGERTPRGRRGRGGRRHRAGQGPRRARRRPRRPTRSSRASARSRSRPCSVHSSARRSATTCTTGSSTWPWPSCTGGWSTTPRPSPRSSPSALRGGRRPG